MSLSASFLIKVADRCPQNLISQFITCWCNRAAWAPGHSSPVPTCTDLCTEAACRCPIPAPEPLVILLCVSEFYISLSPPHHDQIHPSFQNPLQPSPPCQRKFASVLTQRNLPVINTHHAERPVSYHNHHHLSYVVKWFWLQLQPESLASNHLSAQLSEFSQLTSSLYASASSSAKK